MTESLLHYLWQFQYFNKTDLRTSEGEEIQVFNPGNRNTHAGPDFFNARIKIGSMEWIGSVEIHINASGWMEHKHDTDRAYENVVLHVVWKNDKPVMRNDKSVMPTLELKNLVNDELLLKYNKLLNTPEVVPCASVFNKVDNLLIVSMLDRVLMHRLESKAQAGLETLHRNNGDWEETCYQLLCKNFGFKVNAEPFLQLAQSLPYKILLKHTSKLLQIEALLFGQAGFLESETGDTYYLLLKREYSLLSQKYQLHERKLNKAQWKFLRLRPANFPTVRLAQLAVLIYQQKNIFSRIMATDDSKVLHYLFHLQQSEYWQRHYQFEKPSKGEVPAFGESSINNIIMNTVVPLLAAYSKAKDEQSFMDRAIDLLQCLPAEINVITKQWVITGLKCKTAFDSQALLELHNNFCLRRRCLECTIGASLVKPLL